MPSTNKTLFLNLNKWLGYDKPKKDDFNADNQKIDEACLALSNSIENLKAAQTVLETALSSAAGIPALDALSSSFAGHAGDTDIHVTAAEKSAWSSGAGFIIGSYTGNGSMSQKITLGYKPKFGIIFPANEGVGRVSWGGEQYHGNTGFMTQSGCTYGISLDSDGFTVQHTAAGGADGFSIKFNTASMVYVYFLWK